MKKILVATVLAFVTASSAYAADQSILFEVGIGFGQSGSRTDGNDNSKWCKHRNHGRLVMGAVRYRYDSAEVHVAHWFGDDGGAAACDRDSWAVGLGAVIDTQDDGEAGIDDVYASWTPGFAYTWGDDKGFKGQDSDGTNWRLTGNWQTFNRFAVGVGGNDGMAEVAVHRYGSFDPDHGEYFATVGLGLRDFEKPDNLNNGVQGTGDVRSTSTEGEDGEGNSTTTTTSTEVLEDGTIVTTTTTTTTDIDGNVYVTNNITYNVDNSVDVTDNSVTIIDNSITNVGDEGDGGPFDDVFNPPGGDNPGNGPGGLF